MSKVSSVGEPLVGTEMKQNGYELITANVDHGYVEVIVLFSLFSPMFEIFHNKILFKNHETVKKKTKKEILSKNQGEGS